MNPNEHYQNFDFNILHITQIIDYFILVVIINFNIIGFHDIENRIKNTERTTSIGVI